MTEQIETSGASLELALGAGEAAYQAMAERAIEERWAERLLDRDTTLWSSDPRVQATMAERLGWLDAPAHFSGQVPALDGFAEGMRTTGFMAAVLAGMGGSSLAPDVLNRTFGSAPGWLRMRVLDSTDPVAVTAIVDDLDPLSTLFMISSKSGTTTEPQAFEADAWARIQEALKQAGDAHESPGELMVAITDAGKSLESIPHHDELREVFLNPPDIGGRYSALTYVGLVAGSLIGLDLDELLASAQAMLDRCRAVDPADNAGLGLGIAIGTLATSGRDKLTFIADPEIASFGSWLEQLIAESTGKHGVGIVPVDLEPVGAADVYGPDRVFVRLTVEASAGIVAPGGGSADAWLAELAAAGHPIIRIHLPDQMDLGGEFMRWEIATAMAGIVLGIDPFDQPNVEEAKENTRRLLESGHGPSAPAGSDSAPSAATTGAAPAAPDSVEILAAYGGIALIGDTALRLTHGDGTGVGELKRHLARLRPTSYISLQAYIRQTPDRDAAFAGLRTQLRAATRRATTFGYGPRFLHSTGQLHKGGPPIGWFIQFTADHPVDRPIPDWPYTFGQLIDAQALGDFQTLEAHELPILRVHLGPDPDAGLVAFGRLLAEALAGSPAPGDASAADAIPAADATPSGAVR